MTFNLSAAIAPQAASTPLVDFAALGRVLLASVLGGVGLVAVFSVGMLGVSMYVGPLLTPTAGSSSTVAPARSTRRVMGLALAVVCFGIVLAGVALGLYTMLNKK